MRELLCIKIMEIQLIVVELEDFKKFRERCHIPMLHLFYISESNIKNISLLNRAFFFLKKIRNIFYEFNIKPNENQSRRCIYSIYIIYMILEIHLGAISQAK